MLKHDKETRKRGRQEQAEDAIAHVKCHCNRLAETILDFRILRSPAFLGSSLKWINRLAETIPDFRTLRSPAFLGSSLKWINSDDCRDETGGNCEMLPGQVLISPTKGWLQAG
jgi:hypothetical protein